MSDKRLVWVVRPIYSLEHISVRREGIVGTIHFHSKHLRLVKKTGLWTEYQVQVARKFAFECHREFYPSKLKRFREE